MALADVSRGGVLSAINEFDEIGRTNFLSKYGFSPSTKYSLLHNDRRYDSKAICGAAHGYDRPELGPLLPSDFSGGIQTVVKKLENVGFAVTTVSDDRPSIQTAAFVVTWNPKVWSPEDDEIDHLLGETSSGRHPTDKWATGNRRTGIDAGDRIYLLRQGSSRGIIAAGMALGPIVEDEHFNDPEKIAQYVHVAWDLWLPTEDRVTTEELLEAAPNTKWNYMFSSGNEVDPRDINVIETLLSRAVGGLGSDHLVTIGEWPDEVEPDRYFEGAVRTVTVNKYERDPKARKKCLQKFGYACSVCGFDFEEVYGEIGRNYIHVHHLRDIASIGSEYQVEPEKDLRPVCPNCHAMLHTSRPAMSIATLKKRLGR